ncbi:MAG: DUF1223 domain-containing protein [Betaproteobacteria bacterium]|nr:MAG: DUF1223 domain-containing protein [Betaproteobacteria bacterium]
MPRCLYGLLLGLAGALAVPAQAMQCSAQSGPHTAALVELYTSEGCDSCPPADRWLSALGSRGYGTAQVVPIALHVDYWDYIGWKDPFAKAAFSARQRKLAQVQRARIVYTPQVLLQGEDFRAWRGAEFDRAVARIIATPALARIALRLDAGAKAALRVEVEAGLAAAVSAMDAQLYLASYENKLVSAVSSGENRGRTLQHDFVVFEWIGPLAFDPRGRLAERRVLPLLPKAVAGNSGVVAFVQSRSTAKVLQALMLPVC